MPQSPRQLIYVRAVSISQRSKGGGQLYPQFTDSRNIQYPAKQMADRHIIVCDQDPNLHTFMPSEHAGVLIVNAKVFHERLELVAFGRESEGLPVGVFVIS
jgi:hypothetical protein